MTLQKYSLKIEQFLVGHMTNTLHLEVMIFTRLIIIHRTMKVFQYIATMTFKISKLQPRHVVTCVIASAKHGQRSINNLKSC